ncbi:MAG: hypothetical protein ACKV2V_02550 [Blastocatellia bacterium]
MYLTPSRLFPRPVLRRSLCLSLALMLVFLPTGCLSRWMKAAANNPQAMQFNLNIAAAPESAPALDLPVKILRRPATAGVPVAENANVRDAARLALKDPSGKPVPAQFRVLSRWRGEAGDTTRPVKWVLVDSDAPVGAYRLTYGADNPKPAAAVTTADAAGILQVNAGRVRMKFPRQGESMVSGFELDGAERLKQPATLTLDLPRAALLVDKVFAARSELLVNDASALAPGMNLRFEHTGSLPFATEANAGFFFARSEDSFEPQRTYRLDENTPMEEDVFVVQKDDSGKMTCQKLLKFAHPQGARVRDLTAENETLTVRAINGQRVALATPLKNVHYHFERIFVDGAQGPARVNAQVTETRLEENGPLRAVVRQDGNFTLAGKPATPLRFTARYHIYAAQPHVRVQLRLINTGAFGFGSDRTKKLPYAQHLLLTGMTFNLPLASPAEAGTRPQVIEARAKPGRVLDKRFATVSVSTPGAPRGVEITVPEFAENYPKALTADATGVHYDILPAIANTPQRARAAAAKPAADLPALPFSRDYYIFDGARGKSTEMYIGADTRAAAAGVSAPGLVTEPAHMATSRAVRPNQVERRDWKTELASDRFLAGAAVKMEKWLASSYAREANEEADGKSVFEVREDGEHYGWRNFGDLQWGDGFNNLHYDLPWILLREYTRTADPRAFQIGSEMARYRADWGHFHADEYLDAARTWNLKGLAFYEKGDHGTYREPIHTHHWIEGLWLYWALTGDEAVHQSALEGANVLEHFTFTFDNTLSWGESRAAGWPVLGLMAAWQYSGNRAYLQKCAQIADLVVSTEESFGAKGYFIPPGQTFGHNMQPFVWSGYTMLGLIEYWRETGDKRVEQLFMRITDWLVGRAPNSRPVFRGGKSLPDGSYEPMTAPTFWYPNKDGEDYKMAFSMMSVPLMTTAARISGREDLREKARVLYRDTTWFRDLMTAKSPSGEASPIAFRSKAFGGSYPKVYGQFSLFAPEYLHERMTSARKP